jgi:hypothetical protein
MRTACTIEMLMKSLWVESMHGKVRCMCRYSEAVEPGTVWTWNAIGKAPGAWRLAPDANESRDGFLLNHVISDELPQTPGSNAATGAQTISNSDPINFETEPGSGIAHLTTTQMHAYTAAACAHVTRGGFDFEGLFDDFCGDFWHRDPDKRVRYSTQAGWSPPSIPYGDIRTESETLIA